MPKMLIFPPDFPWVPRQTARRPHSVAAALALVLALVGLPASAEKADRGLPLNFAADAARVDEAQRLNILTGNVEITKGTMQVRSDRVEVRQNADGSQTATAISGPEGRAYFRQKRDGVDESIEGMADKVIYEGKDDTVRFVGRAIMRRLKGEKMTDEVTGHTIVFDNKTAVFQVLGNEGNTTSKGRVRGVITPRASEPAKAGAEKPAEGAR